MNNNKELTVRIRDGEISDSENGESSDEGNSFPHTPTSPNHHIIFTIQTKLAVCDALSFNPRFTSNTYLESRVYYKGTSV